MNGEPLIVPLTVEALVVNDEVRKASPFVRTQMRYEKLEDAGNAQPRIHDREDFSREGPVPPLEIPASQYYNGVYLKWRLPNAFAHGYQDPASEQPRFPRIPNRWLVVRYGGGPEARTAAAWIVESDYLWEPGEEPSPTNASKVSACYLQGAAGEAPSIVHMGRHVELGSWAEPGTTQKLTAIAPGNAAFAFHQPSNNNVLSFIDALGDAAAETLSYQVLGWFSVAADDPLAEANRLGLGPVLAELGWTLAAETDPAENPTWSLLSGYVTGVEWQTEELPPGGGAARNERPMVLAAGNTAIEALTALVAAQAAGSGEEIDAELLEALQLDLLDVLDKPDGEAVLAERLQASFFQRFSGGYAWEIVDAPGADPVPEEELARELKWLGELNRAQAAVDADIRTLASMQRELYVFWWKYTRWPRSFRGKTSIAGPGGKPIDRADLLAELQREGDNTLAARVEAQIRKIEADLAAIPQGATPAELEAAIAAYAAERRLPASRELKRSAAPTLHQPNNPALVIAGDAAAGIVQPARTVECRLPGQLVRGFRWSQEAPPGPANEVTAETAGLRIPRPDLGGVEGVPWAPELAAELVDEAFFLDPINAEAVAAAVPDHSAAEARQAMADNPLGTPPDGAVERWAENPWHPLLLLWQVSYRPISYGTASDPNWTFEAGEYTWNGEGEGKPLKLWGTIQLTPAATFNLLARLDAFLESSPRISSKVLAELTELREFVASHDEDWAVLSQTLDGFNNQLQVGLPGTFVSPQTTREALAPRLSNLIGGGGGSPPRLGRLPKTKKKEESKRDRFQPWRAGEFSFTELVVVDEWGQAVWPIDVHADRSEPIYLPAEMDAGRPAEPQTAAKLNPALLQPARLAFELLAADDDGDAGPREPSANPICGWIVPNHVDSSLMAYDPAGTALGEVAHGVDRSGKARPLWSPAPGSPYPTLAELRRRVPHMGPFLATLAEHDAATFAAFLTAIDEALWTTVPGGGIFDRSLAALIGRPLALVRSCLQFELDGPARRDPGWRYTFKPAPDPLASYEFAIELGNLGRLDDGLIGYFVADDYETFNVAATSGAERGPYLRPIGVDGNYLQLPFDGHSRTALSMLIDPRAPVHATTAILPDVELALPPHLVDSALEAMDVSFRVNGVLTDSEVAAPEPGAADAGIAGAEGTTIRLPLPEEKDGTWTWAEREASSDRDSARSRWVRYPLAGSDPTAALRDLPPTLRRGLLQLRAPARRKGEEPEDDPGV